MPHSYYCLNQPLSTLKLKREQQRAGGDAIQRMAAVAVRPCARAIDRPILVSFYLSSSYDRGLPVVHIIFPTRLPLIALLLHFIIGRHCIA